MVITAKTTNLTVYNNKTDFFVINFHERKFDRQKDV